MGTIRNGIQISEQWYKIICSIAYNVTTFCMDTVLKQNPMQNRRPSNDFWGKGDRRRQRPEIIYVVRPSEGNVGGSGENRRRERPQDHPRPRPVISRTNEVFQGGIPEIYLILSCPMSISGARPRLSLFPRQEVRPRPEAQQLGTR